MIRLKNETVLKVLNRYIKGLNAMYIEELGGTCPQCAEHYKFDMLALSQAIEIIQKERSNT